MMSRKVKERMSRAALAGALFLLSQAALSSEGQEAARAPEKVTVTLPQDWAGYSLPTKVIDSSQQFAALTEALDKRVAKDLARQFETLEVSRVELAIAEVPTRG
jgi:hypothetical protein